ncbi:MAG: hypothetical protein HYZ75_15945 [Elusimicrobia bacterium]|nr:hypothetical protein [Elusimicrobiota bacterium]
MHGALQGAYHPGPCGDAAGGHEGVLVPLGQMGGALEALRLAQEPDELGEGPASRRAQGYFSSAADLM